MRKTILAVMILVPTLFITGCISETGYTPRYPYSPTYNGNFVSSTGYGVGDYGLGFGTNYNPGYGPIGYGMGY